MGEAEFVMRWLGVGLPLQLSLHPSQFFSELYPACGKRAQFIKVLSRLPPGISELVRRSFCCVDHGEVPDACGGPWQSPLLQRSAGSQEANWPSQHIVPCCGRFLWVSWI